MRPSDALNPPPGPDVHPDPSEAELDALAALVGMENARTLAAWQPTDRHRQAVTDALRLAPVRLPAAD